MLSCFCLHFVFIIIYSNPIQHPKNRSDFWAQYYVYPFFHQGWNLFVPPPTENYKLFVTYITDAKQQEDLLKSLIWQHRKNKLLGNEPVLLALTNSLYYFEKNSKLQGAKNGPIQEDQNFLILEKLVKSYLEWKNKEPIHDLKIILLTQNVGNGKQRVYFN